MNEINRNFSGSGHVTGAICLRSAPGSEWLRGHAAAVGHWLAGHAWSHFITLTTETPTSETRLVGEFYRLVRRLERLGAPIPWFYAIERNRATGGWPHLHALIAGTMGLSLAEFRRRWFLGISQAAVYDPTRHAAFYVSKGLLIDEDSYDFSRREAPLRRDLDRVAWLVQIAGRAISDP